MSNKTFLTIVARLCRVSTIDQSITHRARGPTIVLTRLKASETADNQLSLRNPGLQPFRWIGIVNRFIGVYREGQKLKANGCQVLWTVYCGPKTSPTFEAKLTPYFLRIT